MAESKSAKRERLGATWDWRCAYCGSPVSFSHNWNWQTRPHVDAPATGRASVDHVVPRILGGHGADNEVLACFRCNASKGKRTLAEWLEAGSCPVPRWRSFAFLFDDQPIAA
jgi:hypothetical protein